MGNDRDVAALCVDPRNGSRRHGLRVGYGPAQHNYQDYVLGSDPRARLSPSGCTEGLARARSCADRACHTCAIRTTIVRAQWVGLRRE